MAACWIRLARVINVLLNRAKPGQFLIILLLCGALHAGVKDGRVVQGQAAFQRNGNLTTIRASDKSIIEYSNFSIASFETVRFIQPHNLSKVLNRVLGPDPSRINGTLRSN
ncbi:MAG: two-partner secretion domain-containing protein, partial [Planctomycetota bacterium]